MQYLLAVASFWSDPLNNPLSALYGGSMVDFDHAHVWAWDARPFPEFPGQIGIWNDGGNYGRGHWLNGRSTNQPLAAVIAELCAEAGVTAIDTAGLYGLVRGFVQPEVSTVRATLQPLLLAYGFDVMERDGKLIFRSRSGRVIAEIDLDAVAMLPDIEGSIETTRAPEADTAGQVRLGFVDSQSSYEIRGVEARFPDSEARGVSQTDLPLALTVSEGQATAERWLAEARIARDGARFALPKSKLRLGAGDVVSLQNKRYRIDRVDQSEAQMLEAVRVEAGVYDSPDGDDEVISTRPYTPTVPVFPVFLDLPLLTGEEVPHAPYIAVASEPWPGSVALWSSSQDTGYEINRLIAAPAVVGLTETPLVKAQPGVWDRGSPLRVRVASGEFASADMLAVLNGANAMAIGDGSAGNWEVFQFAQADAIAPDVFDLSMRLRGQLGTDGLMPESWPIGSTVVLLDLSLLQIDLPLSARGLARYYRVGAAARGFDDPNTVLRVEAFDGAGLRPYPVSHLRGFSDGSGDSTFNWKRRTRIDGDTWQTVEVPLGEDAEVYSVRIFQGPSQMAEYSAAQPTFTYTAAMKVSDGVVGAFRIEVAQVSAQFGAGPYRSIEHAG